MQKTKVENISVIIPMFNSSKTIIKVLDSVRNQTAKGHIKEVIVIDDGSTDNSAEKVEKYRKKYSEIPIKLIHQENQGVSKARNTGLRQAKGEYIALLDSDDIWEKNKLERQIQILEEHSNIYFLGTASTNKPLRLFFWKKVTGLYEAGPKDICWISFPVTSSVIFKREVIDDIGYFDEKRRYSEDIEYFQRFFKKYNYYYLGEKLVEMNIGKKYFGQIGLTSNLKEMHLGRQHNLYLLYKQKMISYKFYICMRIFNELKYLRRLVLRKIHAMKWR